MFQKLDRKEYFKRFNDDKFIAKVLLKKKMSFSMGAVIPHKLRNCGECKKIFLVRLVVN